MTTQEYFAKYNGKFIDFDKAYGAQCVDLYRQYVKEVLQFPQSPPVNGAAEIWDTYLKDKFERIPNTPLGVPQLGDIVIWGKAINGYGDVSICQSANLWSLLCFSQNWPKGSPCHFQKRSYKNILGWLRPLPVVPVFVFPKVPLQIARLGFLGLQLPPIGEFQAQVGIYSNSRISLNTTDYGTPFTIPSVGMLNQDDAYRIVDLVNPKEKFIFIFYPPNNTSSFYATYYYPKKDCVITTCPGIDPRLLTFEFAHAIQTFYNVHRGSNPYVEVIDSNFPYDSLIKSKYDSIIKYYS